MFAGSLGYGVNGVNVGEVYLGVYSPNHNGPDYADAHRPIDIPTKLKAASTDASVFIDADQQRLRAWIDEKDKKTLQRIRNISGHVQVLAICLPNKGQEKRVLFRAVFQANNGPTTVLREQIITDGYGDPADPQLHTQR